MANLADFDTKISSLAHQIAEAERQLWALQATHRDTVEARSKAIEKGEVTTGDLIGDLVIRFKGARDAEFEDCLKIVQGKLTGKKGQLTLFTYSQSEISWRRRGGPGNSSERRHHVWYAACGILSDDKLRLEHASIVFPIDQYAIVDFRLGGIHENKFTIGESPFRQRSPSSDDRLIFSIDKYAFPESDYYKALKFVVGDAEVRSFVERSGTIPDQFTHLCAILHHLILQPTD